jgi:hypothetical protein
MSAPGQRQKSANHGGMSALHLTAEKFFGGVFGCERAKDDMLGLGVFS